jgi:hypothetical protein
MLRRSLMALILATSLAALSVGSAFAHECVISSRSDKGDAGATHSRVWGVLGLADVLGFIHEVVGGEPLTADQIAWALENRGSLPESWVTRMDKTIGEGSANPNLADGRGLDHLEQLVGEQVVGLYFAASMQ